MDNNSNDTTDSTVETSTSLLPSVLCLMRCTCVNKHKAVEHLLFCPVSTHRSCVPCQLSFFCCHTVAPPESPHRLAGSPCGRSDSGPVQLELEIQFLQHTSKTFPTSLFFVQLDESFGENTHKSLRLMFFFAFFWLHSQDTLLIVWNLKRHDVTNTSLCDK